MTAAERTAEFILRAEHSMGFAVDDLAAAVGAASPVVEIAAAELLRAAVQLRDRVAGLRQAVDAELEAAAAADGVPVFWTKG